VLRAARTVLHARGAHHEEQASSSHYRWPLHDYCQVGSWQSEALEAFVLDVSVARYDAFSVSVLVRGRFVVAWLSGSAWPIKTNISLP